MIRFMRFSLLYLIISGLIIIPGIYSLVKFGLRPAIDFTGGTLIEVIFDSGNTAVGRSDIQKITDTQKLEVGSIQETGVRAFLMRLKPIDTHQHQQLLDAFQKDLGKVTESRFETVGPILGKELLGKTFVAAILAILVILSYVAWAFRDVRFGVSAIIAMLHDVLIVISVYSFLGFFRGVEVDSLFVTAILTTMSFSVHDTIVVFDRIRELQKRISGIPFEQLIDQSMNETMVRSLNNSLTIVFMLLALFLLGGATIKWFVLALLIGTISGTYSSPFVAAPVLFLWHKIRHKRK